MSHGLTCQSVEVVKAVERNRAMYW